MQGVIIGASSESIYAIKKARQLGIYTIALDGNPKAEGLAYADKSYVVDIRNHSEMYDVLDNISPDIVIPVPIGRYLTSAGAVNDRYSLLGVTEKGASFCTDKHLFHKTLYKKGARDILHLLIAAGETKISNDMIRYPVIVKPRYGSGNREVRIYSSKQDFQENFLSILPFGEDFIVETCIEGTEYGIDAAIINGKYCLILLREKILTSFPYCQCVGYYSMINDEANTDLYNLINASVSEAVNILGLDNCLLHVDIICCDKKAYIIEMSARPSGHNLHNLFTPLATGVDMISEYLKFALPQLGYTSRFTPTESKCLLIKFFDVPEGKVSRVPDKDYIKSHYPVLDYNCQIERGMVLDAIKDGHSLMSRGYFILQGNNKNELHSMSNEISKLFVME